MRAGLADLHAHHAPHGIAALDETPRPLAGRKQEFDESAGRGLACPFLVRAGARQAIALTTAPRWRGVGHGAPPSALHRRLGFSDAGRLTAGGHEHGRWLGTVPLQRAL